MGENEQRTLGRIEATVLATQADVAEMKEDVRDLRGDVNANTKWRWGITAVGSFIVTLGGYFGLK